MKNLLLAGLLFMLLTACNKTSKFPKGYHTLLTNALIKADSNQVQIKQALDEVPDDQLEGMCFLVAYMPEQDLKTLTAEFLLENVNYAYKAREEFPWGKILPDSIFFNDVLPYASLDEQRDNWRKDFYTRFAPMVHEVDDIYKAIDTINKVIRDELKVDYSTKRKRACQGPLESMEQGMASCTGLSILLTDAFRSVGIPSRLAGTPLWVSKEGNHTWNEVYIHGDGWYFTEYYPSGLNVSWFLERAGKGDPNDPIHAVYASSYQPADTYFRLVWAKDSEQIPAYNVTQRYIDLYQAELDELSKGNEDAKDAIIGIVAFKDANSRASDNRTETLVKIKVDGKVIDKGLTSGPLQDMNDYFKTKLAKNIPFEIEYTNSSNQLINKKFTSGKDNLKIIELSLD